VQESLTLDYKASDSLANNNKCRNEISKDVSAFANSAGGRIIYGIKEQNRLPVEIDQGSSSAEITREWIEQVINSHIQPRVQGIVIKPINLVNGNCAFVVDVPQAGTLAPHQANDQKYYRRYNFESVPMHDYEVRDLFRRGSSPHLFLRFVSRSTEIVGGEWQTRLEVYIGNRSSQPASHTIVKVFVEKRAAKVGLPGFEHRETILPVESFPTTFQASVKPISVPSYLPVFKEHELYLGELLVRVGKSEVALGYSVACPGFEETRIGRIYLDSDGRVQFKNLDPL
jgi:hypothetical protein